MITFEGTYYDGSSSRPNPVTVCVNKGSVRLVGPDGMPIKEALLSEIEISPPLGRTSRALDFSDGSRCATDDIAALKLIDARYSGNQAMRLVHFFESHWRAACVSILAMVACGWFFIDSGIPFLAQKAAYAVPPALLGTVSSKTLSFFDANLVEPSELDEPARQKVLQLFEEVTSRQQTPFGWQLVFRKGGKTGANAFALPSGIILITDELVEAAENDEELAGVLVHELHHVEKRHGLRNIFQNTGVFLLVSALVGDIASISSVAATLPTLLAETGYSRQFEREADEAAAMFFISRGLSTQPYQEILLRIARDLPEFTGSSLLSTHPLTRERIRFIKKIEKDEAG